MSGPLPAEQTAILITAPGGPEVLRPLRVPVPEPQDDELLIAVHAAGVNRHDCNQRRRGPTPSHSDVPGLEVAGTVARVGAAVRGWAVGAAVCALTDGGGYAEYAVAKAAQALPVPRGLDMLQAAALPEGLFTVWHNMFGVAALGPGESVLLHGGTSGVGTLAIQVLRALGHPVFATCGNSEKIAVARHLGAQRVFDYHNNDFVVAVREATGNRGVDVILDMSGGRHSVANLDALAPRGRLIHLSPGDGAEFHVPLRALLAKELRVTGSMLRPLPDDEKSLLAKALLRVVWPLLDAGAVRPVVHRVRPLTEASEAHAEMEAGRHIGKLLLRP